MTPGTIVILNGVPRAGKSSIAGVIQETFDGTWLNLGVDVAREATPPRYQPGVGLRPGEPDHPQPPSCRCSTPGGTTGSRRTAAPA